jgi:hypothetical protein
MLCLHGRTVRWTVRRRVRVLFSRADSPADGLSDERVRRTCPWNSPRLRPRKQNSNCPDKYANLMAHQTTKYADTCLRVFIITFKHRSSSLLQILILCFLSHRAGLLIY